MKYVMSRREDRRMTMEEAIAFLKKSRYVFMATTDPDGNPYCIPINIYMSEDNVIYIHCASKGHKIDNIKHNPHVCISCASYGGTVPTPNDSYMVSYQSVVAFGIIEEVTDIEEKKEMLIGFCSTQINSEIEAYKHFRSCVERAYKSTPVYRISLDSISGKQNI